MSVVRLSDELKRLIERQVAEGRAASPTAFLKEAVMRLLDESELCQAVEAGSADIDTGRYRMVATLDDERHVLNATTS